MPKIEELHKHEPVNAIVQVPFRSHVVEAVQEESGNYWVVIKRLCENFGVDSDAQIRRLQRQPWAVTATMAATGSDGKIYQMVVMDRQTLIMWLATIDTSRLKSEEARKIVVAYQKECAQVLDDYFFKGFAVAPQKVEDILADPDSWIQALQELKKEREKSNALQAIVDENQAVIESQVRTIGALEPKARFADAVSASADCILIADLAKFLTQNGVPNIGEKRLYRWMRENGWLCKKGSYYNTPTQRAMEMKLFEVKETAITCPDGKTRVSKTTKVTGKGQEYFLNLFLKMGANND